MKEFDILESLPSSDNYTPKERYQDFRQVFASDQGKRVMREILAWGRMFKPSIANIPIDPYLMAVREGERNIALKLLSTFSNEPPEPQQTAKRRRPNA